MVVNKDHIVTSFDEELNLIESQILEMGGLVEQQLRTATRAMGKNDMEAAKTVIKGDDRINKLESETNDNAIKILALRQPVAQDLRNVVMALKIASHLERMGDYAKNMARRITTVSKVEDFDASTSTLIRMSERVQSMITRVLDAYNSRDLELAEEIRQEDEHVDRMHNTLFRELLTYMMEDVRNISGCMHLLFVAKNIERMGDHAAEIAQEIIYSISGEWPEDKRPKGDRTSRITMDPEDLDNED
jgi:phosphate transport system protein